MCRKGEKERFEPWILRYEAAPGRDGGEKIRNILGEKGSGAPSVGEGRAPFSRRSWEFYILFLQFSDEKSEILTRRMPLFQGDGFARNEMRMDFHWNARLGKRLLFCGWNFIMETENKDVSEAAFSWQDGCSSRRVPRRSTARPARVPCAPQGCCVPRESRGAV